MNKWSIFSVSAAKSSTGEIGEKASVAHPLAGSAPELVGELVKRAEGARASDIHLQMMNGPAEVFFRLDGVMSRVATLPEGLAERVFGRIKYLAKLKTYQESLPQDGRIEKADLQVKSDVRVSTYPTVTGEKIVLRLFTNYQVPELEQLGLSLDLLGTLKQVLRQTSGLVLLTGPSGSGKTTTIYGCLNYLAHLGGRHIITVEDPVEQILPGIMQTEINEAKELTFAKAARHLLRQDPQVLALGEIRDEETASICIRAASTGHLVISTLHAGSCQRVLERLMLLCPERASVLAGLELVLNQRLLRKLCIECRGQGCEQCLQTGYRGRVPLTEYLRLDERTRSALKAGGSLEPQVRLREMANAMVQQGTTDGREVERVLGGTE